MEFHPLLEQPSFSNLQTSDAWYRALYPNQEIIILDPDGWDRKNYQFSYFEELISLNEFDRRVISSTCIAQLPMMEIIALEEKYVKEHKINPDGYDKTQKKQVEKLVEHMGIDENKAAEIVELTIFPWKISAGKQIGKIEP